MYCKVVQLVDTVELDEVTRWSNLNQKTSSFKNLNPHLDSSSYVFITFLGVICWFVYGRFHISHLVWNRCH